MDVRRRVGTDSGAQGRRWPVVARDLFVGVAVVAALWVTTVPADAVGRVVQFGLGGVVVAAVVLRDRWPMLTTVVSALATGTAWVLGITGDPFLLTGVCVFTVAKRRGDRQFPWWLVAAAAVLLLTALGLGADNIEAQFRELLLSAVVLATSWVLGVRTRQAQRDAASASRAEERLRLARDVHDVLSHSLGVIGVRAGVTAHVTALGEAELRSVLREVESDSRKGLGELNELLQREGADEDTDTSTDAPSVALVPALTDLAETAKRTGLRVRLDVDDAVDSVPAAARTTAQRVAREAVTNVIRHAAASSLLIAAQVTGSVMELVVRDDGHGAGAGIPEGHGLAGMRERIALVGGTLHLESTPQGFVVTATLPLTEAAGDVR